MSSGIRKIERVIVRLVSHVWNRFTIKAPVLVGVSTSYPTSDQVGWRPVHSRTEGSDQVRPIAALCTVAGTAVPSITSDNCLLNMRWHRRRDLSSIHSANTQFLWTYIDSRFRSRHRKNKQTKKHGAFTDAANGDILQVWTERRGKGVTWQTENLESRRKQNVRVVSVGLCLTMIWLLLARWAYFPRHLGWNRDKYSHFTFQLLKTKKREKCCFENTMET